MRTRLSLTLLGAVATLSACASVPLNGPVDVLRYHLGSAVTRGTVTVEPVDPAAPRDVAYRAFADAVAAELTANGYSVQPAGTTGARLAATVGYRRGTRLAPDNGPRVSVGLGGATFGRHTGIGGSVGVPVAGGGLREVVGTELQVKITERGGAGAGVTWEAKGMTEADARLPDAAPENAARKLARALFLGFPGESGRTITVK